MRTAVVGKLCDEKFQPLSRDDPSRYNEGWQPAMWVPAGRDRNASDVTFKICEKAEAALKNGELLVNQMKAELSNKIRPRARRVK